MTEPFYYVVRVDATTRKEADRVMEERIGHDEDYGFEYALDWQHEGENWKLLERGEVRCKFC